MEPIEEVMQLFPGKQPKHSVRYAGARIPGFYIPRDCFKGKEAPHSIKVVVEELKQ